MVWSSKLLRNAEQSSCSQGLVYHGELAFSSSQRAEGGSGTRWMDERFLWWLLSHPELCSRLLSYLWVFCDISCLGKKCERCDVAVRACGCSFPIFLWLSRKQVNWFLYPSGNSCQRLKPAWSKLSRRHKCWGGREPEYSCLLLRWLFPACFARKVHAIAVISKHVFAVEHGMDAHLCKAERALFKMSFSYDARNDTLEGSSSCSTGRGS